MQILLFFGNSYYFLYSSSYSPHSLSQTPDSRDNQHSAQRFLGQELPESFFEVGKLSLRAEVPDEVVSLYLVP